MFIDLLILKGKNKRKIYNYPYVYSAYQYLEVFDFFL